MNTQMMSDEQLAELNGGVAPIVILVIAGFVAVGGGSCTCTHKKGADGSSETTVTTQAGN